VTSVTSPAGQPVDAYVSGGALFVNWSGDTFAVNDVITIGFGVPEAPAWAMMLLGFAFLGFATSMGNHKWKRRLAPYANFCEV
jgi:hypothetical protein